MVLRKQLFITRGCYSKKWNRKEQSGKADLLKGEHYGSEYSGFWAERKR